MAVPRSSRALVQPFGSCCDVASLNTACAMVWRGPVHVVHLLSNDLTGTQGDRRADSSFSPPFSRCSGVWYLLSSEERAHRFLQATWARISTEITAHDVTGQFRKTNWLEEENQHHALTLWLNYFLLPLTGWGFAGKTRGKANGDASCERRTQPHLSQEMIYCLQSWLWQQWRLNKAVNHPPVSHHFHWSSYPSEKMLQILWLWSLQMSMSGLGTLWTDCR